MRELVDRVLRGKKGREREGGREGGGMDGGRDGGRERKEGKREVWEGAKSSTIYIHVYTLLALVYMS